MAFKHTSLTIDKPKWASSPKKKLSFKAVLNEYDGSVRFFAKTGREVPDHSLMSELLHETFNQRFKN